MQQARLKAKAALYFIAYRHLTTQVQYTRSPDSNGRNPRYIPKATTSVFRECFSYALKKLAVKRETERNYAWPNQAENANRCDSVQSPSINEARELNFVHTPIKN